jgi:hypothetical protein
VVVIVNPTTSAIMPITTNVVSSNPAHGEVYSIQHYAIKFVSDLRQVGVFFCDTPVSSTNNMDLPICIYDR